MLRKCLTIIEDNLSQHELERVSRLLYSSYNPFDFDSKIWTNIQEIIPNEVFDKIKPFKRTVVGHAIINELVMKYFPGEITIKYNFIKNHLNRLNEITVFELKINSSRLDIGRINGKSIAYEIKTELDTLDKLHKQITDYSKVFEYVYVIIHPSHLKKVTELVPQHCGIITYNLKHGVCKFSFRKKALKSNNMKPEAQLSTLTNKELDWIIKASKIDNIVSNKKVKEEIIVDKVNYKKINTLYKKVLKKRYNKNWGYLCNHFEKIMPVDIQSFFSTQADPYWVYYKNSSIV
ncbi:sce7726 family protein [Bacillus cereus]|uniref:sce7726 family protein n=1 Tax=Bacillus cereus TaxID=1396 RepID=UPI002ABFBDA7|nr:sce7726 family protein [Bacillus cereus]MDA1783424.1 sce7726 family protein [Bacillus cereus]MDZ4538555.1 sce7726 family protein [Bacillus cereus]